MLNANQNQNPNPNPNLPNPTPTPNSTRYTTPSGSILFGLTKKATGFASPVNTLTEVQSSTIPVSYHGTPIDAMEEVVMITYRWLQLPILSDVQSFDDVTLEYWTHAPYNADHSYSDLIDIRAALDPANPCYKDAPEIVRTNLTLYLERIAKPESDSYHETSELTEETKIRLHDIPYYLSDVKVNVAVSSLRNFQPAQNPILPCEHLHNEYNGNPKRVISQSAFRRPRGVQAYPYIGHYYFSTKVLPCIVGQAFAVSDNYARPPFLPRGTFGAAFEIRDRVAADRFAISLEKSNVLIRHKYPNFYKIIRPTSNRNCNVRCMLIGSRLEDFTPTQNLIRACKKIGYELDHPTPQQVKQNEFVTQMLARIMNATIACDDLFSNEVIDKIFKDLGIDAPPQAVSALKRLLPKLFVTKPQMFKMNVPEDKMTEIMTQIATLTSTISGTVTEKGNDMSALMLNLQNSINMSLAEMKSAQVNMCSDMTDTVKQFSEKFLVQTKVATDAVAGAFSASDVICKFLSFVVAFVVGYYNGYAALAVSLFGWLIGSGLMPSGIKCVQSFTTRFFGERVVAQADGPDENILSAVWNCAKSFFGKADSPQLPFSIKTIANFNTFSRFTANVSWFLEYFKEALDYIALHTLGRKLFPSKETPYQDRVVKFATDCTEMFRQDYHMDLHSDDEFYERVNNAYIEGQSLMKIAHAMDGTVYRAFTLVLNRLESVRTELMAKRSRVASKRPPVVIYLLGPPGRGKTYVSASIAKEIFQIFHPGRPFGRSVIYDVSKESPFEDSYRGQPITRIDDWLQNQSQEILNAMIMSIIGKANVSTAPLNMASIEFKGRTFWNGDAVILTSNSTLDAPVPNTEANLKIQDKTALIRRFDLIVEVDVVGEFLTKKNEIVVIDELKASRLPLGERYSIYRFSYRDYEGVFKEKVNYDQLVADLHVVCDIKKNFVDPMDALEDVPKSSPKDEEDCIPIPKSIVSRIRARLARPQGPYDDHLDKQLEDLGIHVEPDGSVKTTPQKIACMMDRGLIFVEDLIYIPIRDRLELTYHHAKGSIGYALAYMKTHVFTYLRNAWNALPMFMKQVIEWIVAFTAGYAAMLLIMTGINVIFLKFFTRAQSLQTNFGTDKPPVFKQPKVVKLAPSVPVVAQGPYSEAHTTWNALRNNFVEIRIASPNLDNWSDKHRGLGLCLRDIIICRHYLTNHQIEEGFDLEVTIEGKTHRVKALDISAFEVGADLVVLRIADLTMREFRDIRRQFFTHDDLSIELPNCVIPKMRDGEYHLYPARAEAKASTVYTDLDGRVYSTAGYYNCVGAEGKPGDCMTPLIWAMNGEPRKIAGLHVAGSRMVSIFHPLLKENIDELYSMDVEAQGPSYKSCIKILRKTSNAEMNYLNTTSKIQRTLLSEYLDPPLTQPAILHPFTNAKGEKIYPLEVSLQKYERTLDSQIDEHDELFLQAFQTEWLATAPRHNNVHKLAMYEAVNGKREYDQVGQIHMKTGRGYPWKITHKGTGKLPLFEQVGSRAGKPLYKPIPEVEKAVKDTFELLDAGIEPIYIMDNFLKDERRSLVKVDSGDARIASTCPTPHLIVSKMLFGSMIENFFREPIATRYGSYINPHSQEWGALARRLFALKYKHDADCKKMDASYDMVILRFVIEGIGLYCDPTRGLYYRQCVAHLWATVKCQFIVWTDIYIVIDPKTGRQVPQNPSGQYLTTFLNCVYLDYLEGLAAWRHNFNNGRLLTVKALMKEHDWINGGDDNVHATDDITYTQRAKQAMYARYGMRVTSAAKDGSMVDFRKDHEITFLKRKFVFRDGWWYAPLNEEALSEIPKWFTGSHIPEDMVVESILMSVCAEYFHYGAEQHKIWVSFYSQLYEQVYKRPLIVHTYNQLLQGFKNGGNDLGSREFAISRFLHGVTAQSTDPRLIAKVVEETTTEPMVAYADVEKKEEDLPVTVQLTDDPFSEGYNSEILKRTYPVHTFSWSTADVFGAKLHDLSFPRLLAEIPVISEILSRFLLFRSDVEVSFRINGTPRHGGAMLLAWLPHWSAQYNSADTNYDDYLGNIYRASQCPNVIVSPNSNVTTKIVIPYKAPTPYWNMEGYPLTILNYEGFFGSVSAFVLSPLIVSEATAAGLCCVTVYARFVNPELAGYRVGPQGPGLKAQGPTERAQQSINRVASSDISFVRSVTRILKLRPSSVVRGIGELASLGLEFFGYSRELDIRAPDQVVNNFVSRQAQCDGLSDAQPLQLYTKKSVHIKHEDLGIDGVNYDMFDNYKLLPTLVAHVATTSQDANRSRIWWSNLGAVQYTPTLVNDNHYPTFFTNMALTHLFYRGGFKICIYFHASMMNASRYRFVVFYGGGTPAATFDANTIGNIPSQVIDVMGDTLYTVTIPYLNERPFLPINTGMCKVALYVENELAPQPGGTDQVIGLSIWLAAAEDFIVSMPNPTTLLPKSNVPPETKVTTRARSNAVTERIRAQGPDTPQVLRSLFMAPFPFIKGAKMYVQEGISVTDRTMKWSDLYSRLFRFYPNLTQTFAAGSNTYSIVIDPLRVFNTTAQPATPDAISFWRFLFSFKNSSGGIRVSARQHFKNPLLNPVEMMISNCLTGDTFQGTLIGTQTTPSDLRSELHVQVPQYMDLHFRAQGYSILQRSVASRLHMSAFNGDENTYEFSVWLSLSDDYTFNLPLPPPGVWVP